jgi:hypothetical protein
MIEEPPCLNVPLKFAPSVFLDGYDRRRVSVAASFAINALDLPLSAWLDNIVGLPSTIDWVPYGTFEGWLRAPSDDVDVRIALVRVTDLHSHPEDRHMVLTKSTTLAAKPQATPLDDISICYARLGEALSLSGTSNAPLLLLLLPLSPLELGMGEHVRGHIRLEREFVKGCKQSCPHVSIMSSDDIRAVLSQDLSVACAGEHMNLSTFALSPLHFSREMDVGSHAPFTPAAFAALAPAIARFAFRSRCTARKMVVLDCDNTLWGGAVGEVGPKGVQITGHFLALQRFFVGLQVLSAHFVCATFEVFL